MRAPILYRAAAVLLILFAIAHTLGFSQPPDPRWGADGVVASMRSLHFDVQGSSRSFWDFFMAAGLSIGVLYLFAGILAWQLGSLPAETRSRLRGVAWTLALAFAALTVVSWIYLFITAVVFSAVVTLCLASAAWLSAKQASSP
jgi:hypothetical protein